MIKALVYENIKTIRWYTTFQKYQNMYVCIYKHVAVLTNY